MRGILLIVASILIGSVFLMKLGQSQGKQPDEGARMKNEYSVATFAGGCFWCVESDFEKVPGVVEVISGYTGGHVENPSYKQVSAGGTGHVESVQVVFDQKKVSYKELLDYFWKHIDPTDAGGQFVDRGAQYRSVIFYQDEEQKQLADESKAELQKSGRFMKPVVTEIIKFAKFYPAEDYHQGYSKKNPIRYKYYRHNSGRDQFLQMVWGDHPGEARADSGDAKAVKPDQETLKKTLTPLQYKVTQKEGTEPPFQNEYWNNKKAGIYVDIVSGEPLFSSLDKYDSGTGWPSFSKPLEPGNIVQKEDRSFFSVRTEVRSKHGDSHLGHVFKDRPPPTGLRYCMNSAAMRFIPQEDLEKDGYGQFVKLFDKNKVAAK